MPFCKNAPRFQDPESRLSTTRCAACYVLDGLIEQYATAPRLDWHLLFGCGYRRAMKTFRYQTSLLWSVNMMWP
jgi:hypothetical protein